MYIHNNFHEFYLSKYHIIFIFLIIFYFLNQVFLFNILIIIVVLYLHSIIYIIKNVKKDIHFFYILNINNIHYNYNLNKPTKLLIFFQLISNIYYMIVLYFHVNNLNNVIFFHINIFVDYHYYKLSNLIIFVIVLFMFL